MAFRFQPARATIAATNALDHGADTARVHEWLGHSNIVTARMYDKRESGGGGCMIRESRVEEDV